MTIEKTPAELRGEDGKVYHIWLDITPMKASVNEEPTTLYRRVEKAELSPGSGVPDGKYERAFMFDGRPYKDKVRIRGGELFAGW